MSVTTPTATEEPHSIVCHTYTGDVADYLVQVLSFTRTTAKVKILGHDMPECTIPIGVTVTVPVDRII